MGSTPSATYWRISLVNASRNPANLVTAPLYARTDATTTETR